MRILCTLVMLFAAPALQADDFGGWSFDPPDGYDLQPSDIGVSYAGANGGYLFLPQTPATDSRSAGQAMFAEALPTITDLQEVPAGATENSTLWLGSAEGVQYIARSVAQDGQSGTVLFVSGVGDIAALTPEIEAMLSATFTPFVLAPPPLASAFAPMPWPDPPRNRDAMTRARLSVGQARALGLDPDQTLLPGTFDCFVTSSPRAVDARPDLRLTNAPDQTYTLSDGTRTQTGTWAAVPHDVFDSVVQFSAPLNDYILLGTSDGLGQSFDLNHPESDADLTCTQDGPATEALLQQMAAVAPLQGALSCSLANGQTARLLYGNGVYILDGARGSYTAALDGLYDNWTGKFLFSGGPFDLLDGTVEASDGQQTLTISQSFTTGSIFYRSTETTVRAICRAAAPPRPAPLYGPDPAPATARPQGGLPEGLYRSFEGRTVWNGTAANYIVAEVITLIAPGGRMLQDPDFADFGDMPDCSRTTPSGEEMCGEYRRVGPMIAFRDARDFSPEAWSDNARFALTDAGFDIGDTSYTRLSPARRDDVAGQWSSSAFSGGGPGFGGGAGQYTDSETTWQFDTGGQFDSGGRFVWTDNRTTTTLISPDPFLGGVSGGGSNTSSDGGTGRYSLDGLWLSLQFDDGRAKRLPLFYFPATAEGAASLLIDGVDLAPAGGGE